MKKFIILPVENTYNGNRFIAYDEDGFLMEMAIPIDEIKEIKDRSETQKLINPTNDCLEKTYEGRTITEIKMKDGTVYSTSTRTSVLVKMIHEAQKTKEKENII